MSKLIRITLIKSLLFLTVIATSQNKEQLKSRKEALKKDIAYTNKLLEKTKKNKTKSLTYVSILEAQIKNEEEYVSTITLEIKYLKGRIRKTESKINEIKKTIFLIPNLNYDLEIKNGIKDSKIKTHKEYFYDIEPTKLTKQIEKITNYEIRKQNLYDEITRLEKSDDINKEKKIENLKKRYTIGNLDFDSIIIADFKESLKSVVTSLLYTDVSPKEKYFITFNQWFDESLVRETISQPIYYPSINKKNLIDFESKFQKQFNQIPNHLSLLSYDLVGLIYYLSLKSVVTSLLYTDVSPKEKYFITFNQWFDESLLSETISQPIYYPSINKENLIDFELKFQKQFSQIPNHLSLLSYDLVGLIYYLSIKNELSEINKSFKKKNSFKGKIGIFEIENNKINHRLNFYKVDNGVLKEIF